jgi:hypothetical protein
VLHTILDTSKLAFASHRLTLPFFHQGIFYEKQHGCRSSPTLLYSISPIEDKTESPRHFDTIEVIEAESQAVLNTFTERDF